MCEDRAWAAFLNELWARQMTTESQTAPESASGLAGASGRPLIAARTPMAPADRLWVDRVDCAGHRLGADPRERDVCRDDLSQHSRRVRRRIFSHHCSGHLCRHSVRRRDAGAEALQPHPPDGMGRPGSQRAGRLVRGFLDPGFGRLQLGGEPRPFARRRPPVLGDRRRGASRAPRGVEICAAARPGKRRAAGPHDHQPDMRREGSACNSPTI